MENTEDPEEKERKERYKVMAKFVTLRTKRVYGGGEVQLLLFLTLALDRGRKSASRPDHFTPSPIGCFRCINRADLYFFPQHAFRRVKREKCT